MCPVDSKSEGQFGTDRVELGEDVDDKGNMKMADVPAPPGTDFTKVMEGDVLSTVDPAPCFDKLSTNGIPPRFR